MGILPFTLFFVFFGVPFAVASLREELNPVLDRFEAGTRSTGTLLIQRGTETVSRSIGYASDHPGTLNSVETIFMIASLSKQFTATAVLRLVDAGVLKLETKVTYLFPEFDQRKWSIGGVVPTVHHLLNHTAGTPDVYAYPAIDKKLHHEQISITDLLLAIDEEALRFRPGSKWEYSNTGYLLLGEIVRRLSKMSFSEYMEREFFRKWPSTSVGPPVHQQFALSFTDDDSGTRVPFMGHYGFKERHDGDVFTDGNIYSSARDLLGWLNDITSGAVLSPELTQKMFSPGLGDYGYGWIIEPMLGSKVIWHNGNYLGYTGVMLRVAEKDISLVWLRNQEGDAKANAGLLNEILLRLLR